MFERDLDKLQPEEPVEPESAGPDVIISPDTRRADRVPPGQSRTRKWPVLDAFGAPEIDLTCWKFFMRGLVNRPFECGWLEFSRLPRAKVFADFHCVTRWSRLDNLWEGVSTRALVDLAGGLKPEARYALAHAYDNGWTTNLPVSDLLADDALVATLHNGEEIPREHGGPARLIVPRLYAWKSAKWIAGLEFLERDQAGFWERNGYHIYGDPWKEQRFDTD